MSRKPIRKCEGCCEYIYSDQEYLTDSDGNCFHDIDCMMEYYGIHREDADGSGESYGEGKLLVK